MPTKGRFIVVEGLDGAGSTTQSLLLEQYLLKTGRKPVLTKEPTVGLIGGLIKAALAGEWKITNGALQLLFAADRAHHVDTIVKPSIAAGRTVISDRYMFSSLAYGAVSNTNVEWLIKVNSGFPKPDIIIFLDVSPHTSIKRIAAGRFSAELFEKEEKLKAVRREYLKLAKRFGFKVINGERSIEQVSKDIINSVETIF
jgi:dTMP kinase